MKVISKKKKIAVIKFHLFSIVLGFFMIYPLLWLVSSSFKSNETIFIDSYTLIPKSMDAIKNYGSGWEGIAGIRFGIFLLNSTVVTVIGTVTCVFSSLCAAYAFSRIKFKLSNFWFGCVMVTLMIPPQVMIVPQYIILKKLHFIDTLTALILPWCFGGAFFIFLMTQFFRGIPRELDEAASIDGCGKISILFKILVPIVKPSIITSSIFAFYWIWQDFFQPLIFMNSTKKFTVPLALNMYLDPNTYNNYGGLFAMSCISLIPILLFFIIFQKYLVDGIAMDGIKG
ncbi:carbohydrate ABC transporter membrane protein 2 (CUT1 family) [Lachnotalea glycerini]|uniref:Carbohydrate ABC transporter membrane protein 2 (CUT1 family) n=1 Tax=Lachnotalea glycerini TaxID=1763509 RepID=A0A255I3I3_9FIRM|nr:carbohydrate ABC transporter permease [Lachnotalea glycerini]PXV87313.1 carbohydrate ABC transporter membrane protein 2 (CUT1 family) [Lachnotalea glycerini]RDY30475.1 carbohydrate ABC transporter permease [Lachnotalea glycerini]